MHEKYIIRFVLTFAFILAIDLYTFKGIRLITNSLNPLYQNIISIAYWLITAFIIVSIIIISLNFRNYHGPEFYRKMFFLVGMMVLFIVPKLVFIIFHFTDDIINVVRIVAYKLFHIGGNQENPGIGISRAKFITQAGLIAAAIPFASIIYGMVKGRFNYKVHNLKLAFNNLPKSFHGLKVLQISDFHIGSFTGKKGRSTTYS